MAKLTITNEWWSAPAEGDNGGLIIVTGRRDMEPVIATGKFNTRIEVTWKYDDEGMPNLKDSTLMETITDSFEAVLKKDPVAVLTGIYTGCGERNWVFYTMSLPIFQKKFNEALKPVEELLPFTFHAEDDPEWAEYLEMKEMTEIADGDE